MTKRRARKAFSYFYHEYGWLIIGIVAIACLYLGVVGYAIYFEARNINHSFSGLLYYSFRLFLFDSIADKPPIPYQLDISRWLSPLVVGIAAIKGIWIFAHEKIKLARTRRYKDHVIICGLGLKGQNLARDFIERGYTVVILEVDNSNDQINAVKSDGATILEGNARDKSILLNAGIARAKFLLCVTGSDQVNIEIASTVFNELDSLDRADVLQVYVHVLDNRLKNCFYETKLFSLDYANFSARLFNIYEKAARQICELYGPDRYNNNPPESKIITIYGNGKLASELVAQVARVGHYTEDNIIRLKLVGLYSDVDVQEYRNRFSSLGERFIVDFQNKDINYISDEELESTFDACTPDVIYICIDSEIETIKFIRKLSYCRLSENITVIANIISKTGLSQWVRDDLLIDNQIHFFDMLECACEYDSVIGDRLDRMARMVHENYVNSEIARGGSAATNQSLVDWKDLPETLKDANRHQADHISVKLRVLGIEIDGSCDDKKKPCFNTEQIKKMAVIEHQRWMADRLLSGWRYTSGCKDNAKKLSPCLVPWSLLPDEEKQKDIDAVVNMSSVLLKAGEPLP
ncbi:MAG: NmrA family NAD(P)-binding protein [Gammaproteobacteria bacterium]|nr:NmrA family NAD(P)-binding protein [Gammaproteobacteria bacterium]